MPLDTPPWWVSPPIQLGTTFAGLVLAFIARRAWARMTKEYDRSALIRLGTHDDCPDYGSAPIIVGLYPFNELRGVVEANLDVRNVIGFVVGDPIWIDDQSKLPKGSATTSPGFYAYCVIQWEHGSMVNRFADQGFHIRKTRYEPQRGNAPKRERIFIGFGTDSTPDPDSDERPIVAHVKNGFLASWKYQPYLGGGFKAADIRMRALAPQTKVLIRVKSIFTKEWQNAR